MTARNLSIPQRTPATQSRLRRPHWGGLAGGMSARQVGYPAGGRRTAAVFSSLGAAANNSIRSRNRHLASRAVRRLGFAPIPGRRSNSNPGIAGVEATILVKNSGERAAWKADTRQTQRVDTGLRLWRSRRNGNPSRLAPGRARIISTTRRDTCRGCGGRKEWCDCRERTACERARGSTDPRRPSVEACRARNSFSRMISRLGAGRRTPDLDIRPALPLARGDALCMAGVDHAAIGDSAKNISGVK